MEPVVGVGLGGSPRAEMNHGRVCVRVDEACVRSIRWHVGLGRWDDGNGRRLRGTGEAACLLFAVATDWGPTCRLRRCGQGADRLLGAKGIPGRFPQAGACPLAR